MIPYRVLYDILQQSSICSVMDGVLEPDWSSLLKMFISVSLDCTGTRTGERSTHGQRATKRDAQHTRDTGSRNTQNGTQNPPRSCTSSVQPSPACEGDVWSHGLFDARMWQAGGPTAKQRGRR